MVEMLAQYEQLMLDDLRSSQLIRSSIEQILGLPALRLARQDADALRREAEREQAKAVKGVDKAARLSAQAEQLQGEVESIESDLEDLEELRNTHTQARDQASERRERYEEIRAELMAADQLDASIDEAETMQESIRGEIRSLLTKGWWEPVSGIAAEKAKSIESAASEALEIARTIDSKERLLDQLHHLVDEGVCPVCEQPAVGGEDHRTQIDKLRMDLDELQVDGRDPQVNLTKAQQLRDFVSTQVTSMVVAKEEEYRKTVLNLRRDRQKLTDIKERIRGNDRSEIRRVQKEYDEAVVALNLVETSISEQSNKRLARLDALRRTNAEIAALPEANPRINTQTQIYQTLVGAIEGAVAAFAQELRTEVQQVATEIFSSLTSEEDYKRLVINEQYGLSIFDRSGREVPDRSAGAEQVVALSLVGALNRCAVREGPIVMDTPFGRLDVTHRANILKFLPTMGPQVILLVQSGEIDEERDLIHLKGAIGRQFRLSRDGAATRSRIDKVVV